jgi:predicted aspartyl protease
VSAESKISVLVVVGVILGVALHQAPKTGKTSSTGSQPVPQQATRQEASAPVPALQERGRRVIASAKVDGDRCIASGFVNDNVPVTFMIDTGAPDFADFSISYVHTFGVDPATLHYSEWWPGTRFGKIATTSIKSIRIGDVVWRNPTVQFYQNWNFSFGDVSKPLLGLLALKAFDIHVEFEGDVCRLTVPATSTPSQCVAYNLSQTRSDEALRLCRSTCAAVPFCLKLTSRE